MYNIKYVFIKKVEYKTVKNVIWIKFVLQKIKMCYAETVLLLYLPHSEKASIGWKVAAGLHPHLPRKFYFVTELIQ